RTDSAGLRQFYLEKEWRMIPALLSPARARKRKIENLQSCPWTEVELPDAVAAVPTMLMLRERQLLHWLTRDYVRGKGRIVDGGCFLGGSTASLASGLDTRDDRRYKRRNKTIASYDLFRVEPYTLVNFRDNFSNPTVDASFRNDFDANI